MPRTVTPMGGLQLAPTTNATSLFGNSRIQPLPLQTTATSAQPNQPIIQTSPRVYTPLELLHDDGDTDIVNVASPDISDWSQGQQRASQQRQKARESFIQQQQQLQSQARQAEGHSNDEDMYDVTGGIGGGGVNEISMEDGSFPSFKPPTQLDDDDEEEEEKKENEQPPQPPQQPSQSIPTTQPIPVEIAAAAASGSSSLFVASASSSASMSESPWSSSPYLSMSNFSQSQSQSQVALSLTPPSQGESSALSGSSATRSMMSLEPHVSDPSATKTAYHPLTTPSIGASSGLAPLPTRHIAQASKIQAQQDKKKFSKNTPLLPVRSSATTNGAGGVKPTFASGSQKPPVPLFDGTPSQPSIQPKPQPRVSQLFPQQKHAPTPAATTLANQPTQPQPSINPKPIPQTSPFQQNQSFDARSHTEPSFSLSQPTPSISNASTITSNDTFSFNSTPPLTTVSDAASTSAATTASARPPQMAIRSEPPKKKRKVPDKYTQEVIRLELYQKAYSKLCHWTGSLDELNTQGVVTEREVTALMKVNNISKPAGAKKAQCIDLIWHLVRDHSLIEPNSVPRLRKPPTSVQHQMEPYAATQPPETYDDADEDQNDYGRTMDDSAASYSQPIDEDERPSKRNKAAQPAITKRSTAAQQSNLNQSFNREYKQPNSTPAMSSSAAASTAASSNRTSVKPNGMSLASQSWNSLAPRPTNSNQSLADVHSRTITSSAGLIQPPTWAVPPTTFLPAPRYIRPLQPVSNFQLRVGIELIVVIQEYIKFKSTYRFPIEKLSTTFQIPPIPSLVNCTTQSLLNLGHGSGLIRAKVVSFVPVLQQDYRANGRNLLKSSAAWNDRYQATPDSPWCVVTCCIEPEAGQPQPAKPTIFTLYYLDTHWRSESDATQATFTSWQLDSQTGLRHLSTKNSAHYLLEGELFDLAHKQNFLVKQFVSMTMIKQGVEDSNEADDSSQVNQELVERIGRIVGIQSQAIDAQHVEYFGYSPYQSIHVVWFDQIKWNQPEGLSKKYAIDMSNQDIPNVSFWELAPLQNIELFDWKPSIQFNQTESDPLQLAIKHTLNDMYDMLWSSLFLLDDVHHLHPSHEFYGRMLPTPSRALIHVRQLFVKVLEDYSRGLYTHWSLFTAAVRHVTYQLTQVMNIHFDSSQLISSDIIPAMVRPGDDILSLPPIPEPHQSREATSRSALEARAREDAIEKEIWKLECPRAVHKICALFVAYMEQRLESEPTWSDSFGELHISAPPPNHQLQPNYQRMNGNGYNRPYATSMQMSMQG